MLDIINSREYKKFKFRELKQKLQKKYPGASTRVSPAGSFYVESSRGRNLIPDKYPSLQKSVDVYTAWSNLNVVEHWENIEKRNTRGFIADVQNNTVQNIQSGMTRESYEYHEPNTNLTDEEN